MIYIYSLGYKSKVEDIFLVLHSVQKEVETNVSEEILEVERWGKISLDMVNNGQEVQKAFDLLSPYISVTLSLVANNVYEKSTNRSYKGKNAYIDKTISVGKDPIGHLSVFYSYDIDSGKIVSSKPIRLFFGSKNIIFMVIDNQIIGNSNFGNTLSDLKLEKFEKSEKKWILEHGNKRYFVLISDFYGGQLVTITEAITILSTLYQLAFTSFYLFVGTLVVGIFVSYLFSWVFYKPFVRLMETMRELGMGNLSSRFSPYRLGFEINILGDNLNKMACSLLDYIEKVKKEKGAKESFLKELDIGRSIQHSLLPKEPSTKYNTSVYFSTARRVGGDYYDWFDWLAKDETIYVIADGVGKGLSGFLYTTALRSILRTFVGISTKLDDIVINTNKFFCQDRGEDGGYVSAFILSVNHTNNSCHYVNCGHNLPLLKRGKQIVTLQSNGPVFGIKKIERVDKREITLQKNDFVVMYTDGLIDAYNEDKELFGLKRLNKILEESNATTPEGLVEEIKDRLTKFACKEGLFDDITILVFLV